MSVAYRVLQVAGVIETQNARLLDLREKSQWLCDILNKRKSEWDEEDVQNAPKLIRTACQRLVEEANAVFSTCIAATKKWARKFRDELGLNIIDEAGAEISLESPIVWNGDTPLILVGDNN
jgi:hypothetical protein